MPGEIDPPRTPAVKICTGEQTLRAITVRNRTTSIEGKAESDGLFVFIGATAETAWLHDRVQRDRLGLLCAGTAVDNAE
jgi:thioredoxin reductase (NADPH)